MKNINELTEQELYELTDSEVRMHIKLRKAEEGIKLLPVPIEPTYNPIPEKDVTIYTTSLFGDSLCFTDIKEMTKVLDVIRACTSKCYLQYDWSKGGSDIKWITEGLKSEYRQWDANSSESVYSPKLYNKIVSLLQVNRKLKDNYQIELDEYKRVVESCRWIEEEIWSRVNQVRDKFYKLRNYTKKFKDDYLPLAENNLDVAMRFIVKAYSLSQEEQEYILANYKDI